MGIHFAHFGKTHQKKQQTTDWICCLGDMTLFAPRGTKRPTSMRNESEIGMKNDRIYIVAVRKVALPKM